MSAFACGKGTFLFLNAIFLLGGLGGIGVGIYNLAAPTHIIGPAFLGIAAIAAGVVCVLFSIIGCCGALKQSRGAMCCWFIFVLLLVLFQLSVGIASFAIRGDGSSALEEISRAAWSGLYNGPQFERNQLQEIETALQCCGFADTQDMVVPPCSFSVPCKPIVVSWLNSRLLWVAIVVLSVAALQIVGLLLSCCLRSGFREEVRGFTRVYDQPTPVADRPGSRYGGYTVPTTYQTAPSATPSFYASSGARAGGRS